MQEYLEPTFIINAEAEAIQTIAHELSVDSRDDIQTAVRLFYFVRDRIGYTVHVPRFDPEDFRATATLDRQRGFCIQKAVLLIALCRAAGIPARLGFAIIRNHLLPDNLLSILKTKEIPDHGFAELHLNGQWIKATPAFDLVTCQKNRFQPVEFDGVSQAIFRTRDMDGKPHIEYVLDRGRYADLPHEEIRNWVIEALTPEAREKFLSGKHEQLVGN
jgi:transglutaminase-like putative cysteine protease